MGRLFSCFAASSQRTLIGLFAQMAYHDPVMTSIRPRLVVLKNAALEASQIQTLKSVFDVVEVHSPEAAKKMLDGSVGGVVICAPGAYLVLDGDRQPTAAATILERIGEGIGVVDSQGALAWTDARFKVHDEHIRSEFIRIAREALDLFNRPAKPSDSMRRHCKRFMFEHGALHYELIVCPASLDQTQDRVTSVVGVLWEVTSAQQMQSKIEAIDAAGADLLRIEPASVNKMNMAERLKMLEQKVVRTVHQVLNFDNFEIRLLDRETGQLELVIAENISPLKIGEVLYARPESNGISGHVASTGRSFICDNVQDEPMYREGLDNAGSSLTVPLMLHDRVIGTFNIESRERSAFTENDRRFAEIFGRYIAAALNILDLLVVERFTTNEQVAENVVNELSIPLGELITQATALRDANRQNDAIRSGAELMLHTISRLRERLESCTAGPRTILGAELELHRHEPDPLLIGKRILIADDEPAIRETLDALLTQKGAIITVCPSGVETLEALEATRLSGQHFDLVLSDIKMPDRNGYEVYRTAKAINSNTPVILMTGFGYDPHHCIVRASQEGLQSFLFKPFKATQLMDVLKKALAAASTA
jgi:two-component system, sensor histidine kinase SagS